MNYNNYHKPLEKIRFNKKTLAKIITKGNVKSYVKPQFETLLVQALQNDYQAVYALAMGNLDKRIYSDTDYDTVVQLLYYSAKNGNGKAQVSLAKCYYVGTGVTKDINKAVYWLKRARRQGIAEARELVKEYLKTQSKKKRLKKLHLCQKVKPASSSLLNNAYPISNGSDTQDSIYTYDNCFYEDGKNEDIISDCSAFFFEYHKEAAMEGDLKSALELGKCYLTGKGTYVNYNQAIHWLCKAADEYSEAYSLIYECCQHIYGNSKQRKKKGEKF